MRFFPSDRCERVVSIAYASSGRKSLKSTLRRWNSSRIESVKKHLLCRKNILGRSKPPGHSGRGCSHNKPVSTNLCRSLFDKKLEELDFCKLLAREDNRCTN